MLTAFISGTEGRGPREGTRLNSRGTNSRCAARWMPRRRTMRERGRGCDRVALGTARHGPMQTMAAQKRGEVTCPEAKLAGSDARRIILRVLEDAEDLVGEVFGDRTSHACKSVHEEVDGVPAVKIEG